jgi:hypothetical protein
MAALDRRLGQVLWGSAQAKGLRPYMEDRHTVIGSYHPRTSSGQQVQDGVFRSYAAVFDGALWPSAAAGRQPPGAATRRQLICDHPRSCISHLHLTVLLINNLMVAVNGGK